MKNPTFPAIAILLCLPGPAAFAAILYGIPASTITENFDSLSNSGSTATPATWLNNSTIPGWYAFDRTAGTAYTSYISSNGGSAAAGILQSLGSSGSSERALGSQTANNPGSDISYGVALTNSTAGVLSSFNLQYTGETWRVITTEVADGFTFQYQIFSAGTGSLTATTGWNSVASLNYTSPVAGTGTSTAVDGNAAGNRAVIAGSVGGITWNAGDELWLRWTDNSVTGNRRAAIGIDDVSFSAVPEPASVGLVALSGLVLLRRRRG